MKCYKCGSTLGSGKLCLHCGADVSVYRKIAHISNSYYNAGLEKAHVRNLSGAVRDLNLALQYDKRNINARNLLGLVYYEMGETVDALCQWVISKHLDPDDTVSDGYINTIQSDRQSFENESNAIKKFNQALDAAKHEGTDLAIITLKGVISQHGRMVKAYQLLALLMINDGDISKAGKIIKSGLAIDRGNVMLQRLLQETKGKVGLAREKHERFMQTQQNLAKEDVIVPQYTEKSKTRQLLIGAGIAIAACLAAFFTLILPSIKRSTSKEINQTAISYYEKSEEKDSKVQKLTDQLDDALRDLQIANDRLSIYDAEDGTITNYDRLIQVVNLYMDKEYEKMVELFEMINPDVLANEEAVKTYNGIKDFIPSDACVGQFFKRATDAFSAGKYLECIEACEVCLGYNENYAPAIYYIGLSNEARGNDSAAAPYFKRIVDDFPTSEYYPLARKRVS